MIDKILNFFKSINSYIVIALAFLSCIVYIIYLWSQIETLKVQLKNANAVIVQTQEDAKLSNEIKNNLIKQLQKEVKYNNITSIEQINQQMACTKVLLEGKNKDEIKICNNLIYVAN